MGLLAKLDEHAALMDGMMRSVHAELAVRGDAEAGQVRGYRAALFNCTRCQREDRCRKWVMDHPEAGRVPEFCRNRAWIEKMADH